jgi:outer membrane protein TolC
VARTYVQSRACRARLATLEQQLASAREDERIGDLRVQAGRVAEVELSQTRASLADASARLADAQARCASADAGLAELTGLSAAEVGQRMAVAPVGLPAFTGGASARTWPAPSGAWPPPPSGSARRRPRSTRGSRSRGRST